MTHELTKVDWLLVGWALFGMAGSAMWLTKFIIDQVWKRFWPESFFKSELYVLSRLSRRLKKTGLFRCEKLRVEIEVKHG